MQENNKFDRALKAFSILTIISVIAYLGTKFIQDIVMKYNYYFNTINNTVDLPRFLTYMTLMLFIYAAIGVVMLLMLIKFPQSGLKKKGFFPFGYCIADFYITFAIGWGVFTSNAVSIISSIITTGICLTYSILLLKKYLQINKFFYLKNQIANNGAIVPIKETTFCITFSLISGYIIAGLFLLMALWTIPFSLYLIINGYSINSYFISSDPRFLYDSSTYFYFAIGSFIYPLISFIKDKSLNILPSRGKKPYFIVMIVLFSIYTLNFLSTAIMASHIIFYFDFLLSAIALAYFITCLVLINKTSIKKYLPQRFNQPPISNIPNVPTYYKPNGQQFYNPNGQPNGQQFYNPNAQPNGQQFYNPNAQPSDQQFYNPNAQPSDQQNVNKNEVVQDNQNTNENLTITEDKQDGEKKQIT